MTLQDKFFKKFPQLWKQESHSDISYQMVSCEQEVWQWIRENKEEIYLEFILKIFQLLRETNNRNRSGSDTGERAELSFKAYDDIYLTISLNPSKIDVSIDIPTLLKSLK